MSKRHLPSVEALTGSNDVTWITELRLAEVREQLQSAGSMLEALDVLDVSEDRQGASDFVASLARLGCQFVEMAGALSRVATHCTEVDDETRRIGHNPLTCNG